ncbi:MAG: Kelch repeat-containing protein [Myxococcota bacterium]
MTTRIFFFCLSAALAAVAGCHSDEPLAPSQRPATERSESHAADTTSGEIATAVGALLVESAPTPRTGHTAVWDEAAERVLVFGGYDEDRRNDTWSLSRKGDAWAWTELSASGTVPEPRAGHTAVWDAAGQRMFVFGGYAGGIPPRNDIWSLAWDGTTWAWTELNPIGEAPPGRRMHSAVWDATGQRMLIFGGNDGVTVQNLLNDIWSLSWNGDTWAWTELTPTGTAPTARHGHTAVWDAAGQRMLVFGGYDGGWSGETWSLAQNGSTWTWTELAPSPLPLGFHTAVWDAAGQRMLVFGGSIGENDETNDTWSLAWNGSNFAWTKLTVAGTLPAARGGHTAVWDAVGQRALVIGGGNNLGRRNDVWSLAWNATAWEWTPISPIGTAPMGTEPASRRGHTAVWDPAGQWMLIFGGRDEGSYNDAWSLAWNGSTWAWTELSPIGTPPSGRYDHSAVWDAEEQRMLIFGGYDGSERNDTWSLSRNGGSWDWTEFSPTGTPPSERDGHSAVWDAAGHRMLVFGGNNGGAGSERNDTWSLSWNGDTWAWTELAPTGGPPPARSDHTAVWDASGQRMLVFGGWYGGEPSNDLWSLAWTGHTWKWAELTPTGALPSPRSDHTAVWDASGQRMLVFGGNQKSWEADSVVWALEWNGEAWAWTELAPSHPTAQFAARHTAVWDSVGDRMLVFGGQWNGNSPRNDVWYLAQNGSDWAWSALAGWCQTTPPAPVLQLPAEGAAITGDDNLQLTWSDDGSQSGYRYEVDLDDETIAKITAFVGGPTKTTVDDDSAFAVDPGEHTWRVRAVGCGGVEAISETRSFHIELEQPACSDVLCEPCVADADCGPCAVCTPLASGDYCLVECTRSACPEGTVCDPSAGAVCIPDEGDCSCEPHAAETCFEGSWVAVDSCGVVGDVLELCGNGCIDGEGCCPDGTEAQDGACVVPSRIDVEPDASSPDAATNGLDVAVDHSDARPASEDAGTRNGNADGGCAVGGGDKPAWPWLVLVVLGWITTRQPRREAASLGFVRPPFSRRRASCDIT